MPTYRVTDPRTGRVLKVSGDTPPTAQDLDRIFSEYKAPPPMLARAGKPAGPVAIPAYQGPQIGATAAPQPPIPMAPAGQGQPAPAPRPAEVGIKGATVLPQAAPTPTMAPAPAPQRTSLVREVTPDMFRPQPAVANTTAVPTAPPPEQRIPGTAELAGKGLVVGGQRVLSAKARATGAALRNVPGQASAVGYDPANPSRRRSMSAARRSRRSRTH